MSIIYILSSNFEKKKKQHIVLLNRFQIPGNHVEDNFLNSKEFCNHTTDKGGLEG